MNGLTQFDEVDSCGGLLVDVIWADGENITQEYHILWRICGESTDAVEFCS